MIPDRNVRNTHAQDIVVKDEVLRSILKTFAHCIPLELPDVFSLSAAAKQSVATTNSSPTCNRKSSALRQARHQHPFCRDHLMVWSVSCFIPQPLVIIFLSNCEHLQNTYNLRKKSLITTSCTNVQC